VRTNALNIAASVLIYAVVAAAQDRGRTAPASENALRARVQEYWARRQAKDLVGAYPFYCQAYRSKVSLNDYTRLTRLNRFDLSDVRVAGIVQKQERYDVTISYRFVAPMITQDRLEGQATEAWKRDSNGQWCKEDEPAVLPTPRSGMSSPASSSRH
jgi:hypothetical protein